jgi:glycosyltransferase involved in cell wall biosynthesis
MIFDKSIGVVVPCYNEEKQINKVVETMPNFVDRIICVDDASKDETREVLKNLQALNGKLVNIFLEDNVGVGGAIDAGYRCAIDNELDLVAVMGGDGQMNPDELTLLVQSLIATNSDYSKITRLYQTKYYSEIPKIRLIGNSILSILTRLSSGFWNMSDSQTGYTVITREALAHIQGGLWKQYGFPNDVLNKLGLIGAKIVEIPSRPIYGVGEVSSLKPTRVALPILKLLIKGFATRIKTQYFLRAFHPIGVGYLFSIIGIFLGGLWLTKIFIYDFFLSHNTHPLELLSAFFLFQISTFLIWLTLMFDAMINKDNCIMLRNISGVNL